MGLWHRYNVIAFLLLTALGCVSRHDIEEIKAGQAQILAKLDKISSNRPAPRPAGPVGPDANKVYAVEVGDSPSQGSADAWVTLVEISDFQCPFCQRATETLKQVRKDYGSDLRVVFKHNPLAFHSRALPAALAAECARAQGKFWKMHDKLFANPSALEDTHLLTYAKETGLDTQRFKKCLGDRTFQSRIEADQALAARLGARGTPAFFINGRFLSGAQPLSAFKTLIDAELKRAKASGIAKNVYYVQAIEEKGDKAM